MTTELPVRLRETAFRRFEKDIAAVVKAYPAVVTLDAKQHGLSNVTYRARLADAMLSLHRYDWTTDKVDVIKFVENYDDIVISHIGNTVIGGSRRATRQWDKPRIEQATAVEQTNLIHLRSDGEKRLLCQLAAMRLLSQPIKVIGIAPSDVETLESSFDVRVDDNNDGTYSVI